MAQVVDPQPRYTHVSETGALIREYVTSLAEEKRWRATKEHSRALLLAIAEVDGEPYENEMRLTLENPFGQAAGVSSQRRVRNTIDASELEALSGERGLGRALFEHAWVPSSENIMRALSDGLISEADIDRITSTVETHAMIVRKIGDGA